MTQKIMTFCLGLVACLSVAGCVSAIDRGLPYGALPEITVATDVKLVASPSHPTANLAVDPIPGGTPVEVLGVDKNAAWLLVLHENQIGWMPTVFSRDNIGTLKAALVIDPLDARCTEYRTDATTIDKVWTSGESGAAIVQGAIYRRERSEQFNNAKLTLNVDGSGTVVAADYIHTPLTSSSALVLFTFAVADLVPESRLHFTLDGTGDELLSFEAALYSNACPDTVAGFGSSYTNELPIGQEKSITKAVTAPVITESDLHVTPTAAPTTSAESSAVTTSTVGVDAPQGQVLLDILSTRAGPSFDYHANGVKLQGDQFSILARVCSETGDYEWYLIARQEDDEYWIPGLSDFITVANVDTLICLPPPPTPEPDLSSVTVIPGIDVTAELITDTEAFAPFLVAIAHYRLAEKASLALPNSPAVRQLPDYAQGAALTTIQDTIRQLRSQRTNVVSAIEQLEIKLVLKFRDGTASVLAQESSTRVTQRLAGTGSERTADETYRGPILYSMRFSDGRWQMSEVILLGESAGIETAVSTPAPNASTTISDESLEQLRTLLATKNEEALPGSVATLDVDSSSFLRPESSTITGRISANTVLKATGGPYIIQGEVTIDNGFTLLIEAGAIVKFEDDSFINIDGVLNARGKQESPILFTSNKDDLAGGDTNGDGSASTPAPGDWTMIRFRDTSNDVNSIIEYAVIRYAGEYRGNRFGAIHLESASPTLIHNVIEDSFWFALSGDLASFPAVSGNHLARNGGNGFEIREGQTTLSGIWRNTDMVYAILRPIVIREGTTLAVEAGVVVKFADDAYLDVYGAFKATGTIDDPVIFTSMRDDEVGGDTNGDEASTAPAAGDWTMIRFYDASNDANSRIDHAIIRYAGEHNGTPFGAIQLQAAAPTITNNTIEDNFWYAVSGDAQSFPVIAGNKLQRNVGNGFEIHAGNMTTSGIWHNNDLPYVVLGILTINDGTTLNIDPGVVVKFGNDAYLDIYGAFRAIGTDEQPITFTSLRDDTVGGDTNGDQNSSAPAAGDWTYIGFRDSSNDANSTIQHAVIRYAGENRNNHYGAIYLEAAAPAITDNTLTDNFWYAISGDIHSFPTVSSNELDRNGGNGFEIRGGAMTLNGVWRNTDIVYSILAPLTINEGAMLTIEPGVMVKFGTDAYFDVNGAFRALGSAEQPILFTSLSDDSVGGDTNGDQNSSAPSAGDWTYIGFKDRSNDKNCVIDHATIRYAGKYGQTTYGAIYLEAASPTLTNNTIEQSFNYAISADVHSFPTINGNQLWDNAGNGLLIREGRMTTGGVWRNTDIVYTVLGSLSINEGTLLTIEPGVVVKFGNDSLFDISGAFKAIGSEAQPITFTSLRDDTVGGDTNGDGASTTPTAGDWTYIGFKDSSNDANSRIEYSVIHYAGESGGRPYGAIYLESASPTIANNRIEENFSYGIWHNANSSPDLSENSFKDNGGEDVFAAQ